MLSNRVVYKLLTDEFGSDFFLKFKDSENYGIRLLTQKFIYMYQAINKINGFNFNWYLAGPYSPELTSLVYDEIIPNLDVLTKKELQWKESAKVKIKKVKDFFRIDFELEKNGLSKFDWYELMASCHYVKTVKRINSKDELEKNMNIVKSKFPPENIKFVVSKYWERKPEEE